MTKIFLAASMNFYQELVRIESALQKLGLEVEIPVSAKTMKAKNDFDPSHFKNSLTYEQRSPLIHQNFQVIAESDAILVINNEKNGIKGYIGANVLMEIAIAFYFKKKIYLLNPVPVTAPYKEELILVGATEINQDLEQIHV